MAIYVASRGPKPTRRRDLFEAWWHSKTCEQVTGQALFFAARHEPAMPVEDASCEWVSSVSEPRAIAKRVEQQPQARKNQSPRRKPWALEFGLLNDRGAVEGNSRGSHGGECNEPPCDPRYLHPERTDRGAVALSPEWGATRRRALHRLRRTFSVRLTMRPLRGRT